MYIQLCTQVMYSILGSHVLISLVFSSSSRGGLDCFRRYKQCTNSKSEKPTKTGGRYILYSSANTYKIMYIQVCTQVMYSFIGSHLCISLISCSSSRGALSHFWHYNYRTHSITKKPTKPAGRYIHQSTQKNNYVNLAMYLGECILLQLLIYELA